MENISIPEKPNIIVFQRHGVFTDNLPRIH